MKTILLHGLGQTSSSWKNTINTMGKSADIYARTFLIGLKIKRSAIKFYILLSPNTVSNFQNRSISVGYL